MSRKKKGHALKAEIESIVKAKKDIKEFDYLYRKYFPMINNFVYRRVYDFHAKNDIVSNTFCKAMKKIYLFRFFDAKKSSFSSWLYRIAISEINQYYRNIQRENKIIKEYKSNFVKSEPIELDFEAVKEKVRKLPVDEQNLITLRFYEKLSYKQMSEILRKSEGALKVKLHRCLKKLRNCLEKEQKK